MCEGNGRYKTIGTMFLTPTELLISAYATAGYSEKEIAEKIFRSTHTVHFHVKNIRCKNNLKNMAEISREFVLEFGDPKEFLKKV